jgi:hypothetical protein
MRNIFNILVGVPEIERSTGRHRRTSENTIKLNLNEMGYKGVHWTQLAQKRFQ